MANKNPANRPLFHIIEKNIFELGEKLTNLTFQPEAIETSNSNSVILHLLLVEIKKHYVLLPLFLQIQFLFTNVFHTIISFALTMSSTIKLEILVE
jgi:hypothetical protein